MTTIAYRDGVLAADSQVNSANGARCGSTDKIGSTSTGYGGIGDLWAFSGDFQQQAAFVEWARGPRETPPPSWEEAGVGVIIPLSGAPREWWGSGWVEYEAPFYAWGSGERIARGALMAGADAVRAVEIAVAVDTDTGGEVKVLRR